MPQLRYADLVRKPLDVLDMTSLTPDEFQILVPSFEAAFQAHMAEWRLDGKPRTARRFTTYKNCPLPTPQDRLLFILVYLKTNPLQVAHGLMFGLPQGKTNQWIHILLPVVRASMRSLGDAPTRSLRELAQRLGVSVEEASAVVASAQTVASSSEPASAAPDEASSAPLFAMTVLNDASHAPKMLMNRKAAIAARRSAIPLKMSS
jgi:hypothetical protein